MTALAEDTDISAMVRQLEAVQEEKTMADPKTTTVAPSPTTPFEFVLSILHAPLVTKLMEKSTWSLAGSFLMAVGVAVGALKSDAPINEKLNAITAAAAAFMALAGVIGHGAQKTKRETMLAAIAQSATALIEAAAPLLPASYSLGTQTAGLVKGTPFLSGFSPAASAVTQETVANKNMSLSPIMQAPPAPAMAAQSSATEPAFTDPIPAGAPMPSE